MPDTIAKNANGDMIILKGNQWVPYTGPDPALSKGPGGSRASQQDVKLLNEYGSAAADAAEVERIYKRAATDIKKFHTGPYRGTIMGMATPEDNGGFMDKLGAVVIGAPARLTGAITSEDTNRYQKLRSLQQYRVLGEQTRQKGVQTEGDAARIMLAEISPTKTEEANMDIIRNGIARMQRVKAKAAFYTKWANKYGLHGQNAAGQTADQVWGTKSDILTKEMFGDPEDALGTPSKIRVISRTKVR